MKLTVEKVAKSLNLKYIEANGFVKALETLGYATRCGDIRPEGGRGRSLVVYDIPQKIEIELSEVL